MYSEGIIFFIVSNFSVIILSFLLFFFSHSLLKNQTPIITRFAKLLGAENSISESIYTRKVTITWLLFFASLLSYKILFLLEIVTFERRGLIEAMFYIGSAVLFVGEFYIRQFFLPAHRGTSLVIFLKSLSKVSFQSIWTFDK